MAYIDKTFNVVTQDVLPNGNASYKAILSFLENVACKHSDIAGYGVNDIPRTHYSWVLLNWRVKLFSTPRYGDEIKVITWSRDGNKFVTYRDFKILKNGAVIGIASSKWALIDTEKGLSKITDEIYDAYQPENERVFDEIDIKKMMPTDTAPTFFYKVLRRDIDVNNHMHNTYYYDIARELLPEEALDVDFKNLDVTYKIGALLGETLACSITKTELGFNVTIKGKDNGNLHAVVVFS